MRRAQAVGGGEPVGSRLVDQRSKAGATAQGMGDRRRAGQQRVVPRTIVGRARPQHGAVLAAHRQHPIEGPLHGGPQVIDEGPIPRAQPVMPHACGDVRAHVGVELGFLDASIGQVVVPPTAVVALHVDEPFVAPFGGGVEAGDIECHGGLDMVPRVAMPAGKPRDHPCVELQRSDPLGGLDDVFGGQHALDVRQLRHDQEPFGRTRCSSCRAPVTRRARPPSCRAAAW